MFIHALISAVSKRWETFIHLGPRGGAKYSVIGVGGRKSIVRRRYEHAYKKPDLVFYIEKSIDRVKWISENLYEENPFTNFPQTVG